MHEFRVVLIQERGRVIQILWTRKLCYGID